MSLIALICNLCAALYGAIQLLRKKRGKYYLNVFLGFLCLTLGRLFLYLYPITGGSTEGFCIGDLGILSGFCFFICANSTLLPKMCDNSVIMPNKFAVISFALSAVEIAIGIAWPAMLCDITVSFIFRTAAAVLPPVICSYFTLRVILIPDIRDGFASCMRPFNIVLSVLTLQLCANELLHNIQGTDIWAVKSVCMAVGCICTLIAMPILEGGYRRWIA